VRIGFDCDGVLAEQRPDTLEMIRLLSGTSESTRDSLESAYYGSLRPRLAARDFIYKTDQVVVITARPKRLERVTRDWVEHFFVDWPIYMVDLDWSPSIQIKRGYAKAKLINSLQLDVYFEDDADIVEILRSECPKTKIVRYGGGV